MSALRELTEYKNTIVERIIKNQNLVKALYYSHSNYEEQPDLSFDEIKNKVLYSNIFPFNFIPTGKDELKNVKGYLTISVTDIRPTKNGVHFNSGSIFISVYIHKDMFRTDYGYLRTDFIASEIHELLNQKSGIGIGKLEFKGMREASINSDYHGVILHYRPVEFN